MIEEKTDSVFHRTHGAPSCGPGLPERHRDVLGAVGELTHFDAIAARLSSRSTDDILCCLDDLEAIGLIESIPLEWVVTLCMLDSRDVEAIARHTS